MEELDGIKRFRRSKREEGKRVKGENRMEKKG